MEACVQSLLSVSEMLRRLAEKEIKGEKCELEALIQTTKQLKEANGTK